MNTCTEIRRRIRAGETEGTAAHLANCSSCAEFEKAYQFLGELEEEMGAAPAALDTVFVDLEKRLARQSKVRGILAEQPTWVRLIAVGLIALGAAAVVWLLMRRADWYGYPLLRWLSEASAMVLIGGAALAASLRPLHKPPRNRPRVVGLAAALSVVLLTPLLLPPAQTAHLESLKGVGDDLIPRALACFRWGIAMGLMLVASTFLVSRGTRGITALSALTAAAAGLFAQLLLHLHCPIVHPLHIGLGHTSIVPALLGLLGLAQLQARRMRQ